jgi:hypothetical protein
VFVLKKALEMSKNMNLKKIFKEPSGTTVNPELVEVKGFKLPLFDIMQHESNFKNLVT